MTDEPGLGPEEGQMFWTPGSTVQRTLRLLLFEQSFNSVSSSAPYCSTTVFRTSNNTCHRHEKKKNACQFNLPPMMLSCTVVDNVYGTLLLAFGVLKHVLFAFLLRSDHGFPLWSESPGGHDVHRNPSGLLSGGCLCSDSQVGLKQMETRCIPTALNKNISQFHT